MAQVGCKSQGGVDFARGIHATLQNQTTLVKDSGYSEWLCSPHKKQGLRKRSVRTARQIGSRESASQILPGLLQPSLSGAKAQQALEAYPRPQPTQSFPASGHFQDGGSRNNQTFPPKRRVGNLEGLQRRLLSHPNQPTVLQVPPVLTREEGLSVHSSTVRASYGPARVYQSSQGGEIDGTGTGYPDPPVPRRLVSQGPLPQDLPVTYPDPLGPAPRFRVAGKHDQIGAHSTTGVQFRRLPVRSPVRSGSTHSRQMGLPTTETSSNKESEDLFSQTIHVTNRTSYCHRETSLGGLAPHEAHSVASEKTLARSREFRENYPNSSVTPHAFRLVAKRGECSPGSALHPLQHALQIFTDASNEGWGAHLGDSTARGTWSQPESQLHINFLELKAVLLALKSFEHLCRNQIVLIATDNTTVVSYINKEGGMRSGSLCALLWRLLSWCHLRKIVLRARHIPGRLNVIADKLSRHSQVVQTEWSLSQQVFYLLCSKWGRPQVDLFATNSITGFPSLSLRSRIRQLGQCMLSACHGKIWMHTCFPRFPYSTKWCPNS